jgi:hypothetical protein
VFFPIAALAVLLFFIIMTGFPTARESAEDGPGVGGCVAGLARGEFRSFGNNDENSWESETG